MLFPLSLGQYDVGGYTGFFFPNSYKQHVNCFQMLFSSFLFISRHALSVGGTCSVEHGVGCGKRVLLVEEMGEEGVALLQRVKEYLDPNLIMNPGNVLNL